MDLKSRTNQIAVEALFGGMFGLASFVSFWITLDQFTIWVLNGSDGKDAAITALITILLAVITTGFFNRSERHKEVVNAFIKEKE